MHQHFSARTPQQPADCAHRQDAVGTAPHARPAHTAGELLVDYLAGEGVEYLFGIPGGPLMPLYEALFARGQIRHVLAKHEAGAAFMADGYARISGRLGVCCATTGPGATNALTGIANAYRDAIPVLLLTAQVPFGAWGKGAAQESSMHGIDVVSLYQLVTKASVMLLTAPKMAETMRFVLRTALSGCRGPVHLNLPADLMRQQVHGDLRPPSQYRTTSAPYDPQAVREACRLLTQSRRPAILAGYGVYLARAWPQLQALAELGRIPVATTPKAKGIFPEDHPLSLGVLGFAGSPRADAYCLNEVDVLLTVGSALGELSTHGWTAQLMPRRALIQLDVDAQEMGKNYPVGVSLVGDARTILTAMVARLRTDLSPDGASAWHERERAVQYLKATTPWCVCSEGFTDDAVPLHPQRVIAELQQALPENALLFVDIGNVMAWAIHFLQVTQPGSFHINLGLASMGYAIAGAIGAKLAAPARPVVALVGDAAFAMQGMEIHTAVERETPVVWVVMNNGRHGMVCHGERLQFQGAFSTGVFTHPLSVAGLARAMGADAIEVQRPGEVSAALRRALHTNRPTVIDVAIDPEAMPPLALRIETLDRFFAGHA
jgi:acetolactate synthase-1/2/3 large subunit